MTSTEDKRMAVPDHDASPQGHSPYAEEATPGEKAHAFQFKIDRAVQIALMLSATLRTNPFTIRKRQAVIDISANMASLGRRKKAIHWLKASAFFFYLIFQNFHHRANACIMK